MGLTSSSLLTIEASRQFLSQTEQNALEAHIERLVDPATGRITLDALVLDSAHLPKRLLENFYRQLREDGKAPTAEVLFRAIATLRAGNSEAKERALFDVFDVDGDGFWSEDEAEYFFSTTTIPRAVSVILVQNKKISFDNYLEWLKAHGLNPLTKLMMPDNYETPTTLTDVLASVTGFTERDIKYLQGQYARVLDQSTTGKLDREAFVLALSVILPEEMSSVMFDMFDTNQDGQIDFRELASSLSVLTRGTIEDKLKFCFEPTFASKGSITEARLTSALDGIWKATYIYNHQSDQETTVLPTTSGDTVSQLNSLNSSLLPTTSPRQRTHVSSTTHANPHSSSGMSGASLFSITSSRSQIASKDLPHSPSATTFTDRYPRTENEEKQPTFVITNTDESDISTRLYNQFLSAGLTGSIEQLRFPDRSSTSLRNRHSICGPIVDSADLGTFETFIANCRDNSTTEEGEISISQLIHWAKKTPVLLDFIQTLSKIGLVVFGVRPQTKTEEAEFVMEEMNNHMLQGLCRGATVYVLSADWWEAWQAYTDCSSLLNPSIASASGLLLGTPGPMDNTLLIAEDDGLDFRISVSPTQKSNWHKVEVEQQQTPLLLSPTLSSFKHASEINHDRKADKKWFGFGSNKPREHKIPLAARKLPVSASTSPIICRKSLPEVPKSFNRIYKYRLKWNLVQNQDFVLVPFTVWHALRHWYTAPIELPRPIIPAGIDNLKLEVELYPLVLYVVVLSRRSDTAESMTREGGQRSSSMKFRLNSSSETKLDISRSMVNFSVNVSKASTTQHLKSCVLTAHASLRDGLLVHRRNARLWNFYNANRPRLLETDSRLDDNGLVDSQAIVLEIRDTEVDVWPSETSASTDSIRSFFHSRSRSNVSDISVVEPGLTGLQNLGNTCFMNAALQCLSNTGALTTYFLQGYHKVELNPDGALSCQGMVARSYGNILRRLWSGREVSVAPVKLKLAIGKFSPQFNGSQQHDSHELLSFLLDGLHEDLNRVTKKPYGELADSNGRENSIIADEYWADHKSRNNSIITDLFHGMLHNQTRCLECGHENIRFDPFNYLTLPLPSENNVYVEIVVVKRDGSTPVQYGVNVSKTCTNRELKEQIEALSYIPKVNLILLETAETRVVGYIRDSDLVKPSIRRSTLHAYEVDIVASKTVVRKENFKHALDDACVVNTLRPAVSAPTVVKKAQSTTVTLSHADSESVLCTNTTSKVRRKLDMWRPSFSYLTSGSSKNPLRTKSGTTLQVSETLPLKEQYPKLSPRADINHNAESLATAESIGSLSALQPTVNGYFLIALHRVCDLPDILVPGKQKPRMVGRPIMLSLTKPKVSHKELYEMVFTQIRRYVNFSAYREKKTGERFFTIKQVNRDGRTCSQCEWYKLCTGCHIDQDTPDEMLTMNQLSYIGIEWDISGFYLYFDSDLERQVVVDSSVKRSTEQRCTAVDMMDCVSEFNSRDRLENDEAWYCPVCKRSQAASKSLSIWSLPSVLIIHLKRFHYINGRWVKNSQKVDFPMHELSLPARSKDESNKKYTLFAIANHSGALGGGHYTTYAKNYRSSEWYSFNDDKVAPVEKSELVSNRAYYLFYAQDGVVPQELMPTDIDPQPFTKEWLDAKDTVEQRDSSSHVGAGGNSGGSGKSRGKSSTGGGKSTIASGKSGRRADPKNHEGSRFGTRSADDTGNGFLRADNKRETKRENSSVSGKLSHRSGTSKNGEKDKDKCRSQ
eukprot:CFRG8199T1